VHLQAFTPLMTSLTLSVVCGICARNHHQVSDDADTYTISPVVGYMMICVGVLCCIGPFLPGIAGDISTSRFFWYSSPFWLLAFSGAAFFFRYRVVVRDQTLKLISLTAVVEVFFTSNLTRPLHRLTFTQI
jgi:hypothetical protein